ncbi:glycosyltransferase [Halorarum salinum]|uniref:Glycosyltransferase n=1 Tax=Halorarum salinum TaxID=2743089 RepID=A0A7D5Q7X6_9EURY|nr:glycosyltransferase [Halobaculum salinum]QLG60396.1 glycosyltransferase [Halobaculum salinum]
MRVLQLVTTESPFFEKQVEALERQGVSCTTVSLPRRTGDGRSVRAYGDLYRRLLSEVAGGFDVVHANYGLVGPLALAQPRRPVVLTLWGSEIMGAAGWLDAVSAWTARRSDAVIAPSAAVSERLDCEHHVVPFGVDTDLFRPIPRDDARELLGWDRDADVVLFPYPPSRTIKNHPLAEAVVDRLPTDAELKTMDGVPYGKVPLYMNASDAVLVTSRRESGPMVVKEAAACEVPVVSTDVGFVADVLDGVEGSSVCSSREELVDGLAAALESDGPANGRAGPDVPDVLGLDRMGERLVDVYRSAAGRRGVTDVRA